MTVIFVVATLNKDPKRFRNWGWYSTQDKAVESVRNNHTDLFERGYYTHAVVFPLPMGLCCGSFNSDATWFKAKFTNKGDFVKAKILPKSPKFMDYYFLSL